MSGPLVKGALVEYLPTLPPTPVVTVFQYNPESMVHSWTQPEPTGKPGVESSNPQAVPGMPGETFQFTIFLDADDDVVSGVQALAQAAEQSGVGSRLAALEMLLYPTIYGPASGSQPTSAGSGAPAQTGGLLGTASAAGTAAPTPGSGPAQGSPGTGSSTAATWNLPNSMVPVVLFVWNAYRIVPVRVTALTITETLYDTDLNPTHAQAQLSLRVVTPTEFAAASPAPGTPADLATVAYNQTLGTRRQWAASNTATAPVSITSMIPH
jgi:hypothetical protein